MSVSRQQSWAYLDSLGAHLENADVSKGEIDLYLATLDEPKRATLAQLRDTIVAIGAVQTRFRGQFDRPGFSR
jgi:hypothetical protein